MKESDYEIKEKRRIEGRGKFLVKYASIRHTKTGATDDIEERLRLYTRSDLLTMAASAGLDPVGVFGDYQGNEYVNGVS